MVENQKLDLYDRKRHGEKRRDDKKEPLTEKEFNSVSDFRLTRVPELLAISDQLPSVYDTIIDDVKIRMDGTQVRCGKYLEEDIFLDGSTVFRAWVSAEQEKYNLFDLKKEVLELIPDLLEVQVTVSENEGEVKKNIDTDAEVPLEGVAREFIRMENDKWKVESYDQSLKEKIIKRISKFTKTISKNLDFKKAVSEYIEKAKKYNTRIDVIKQIVDVYEIVHASEKTDELEVPINVRLTIAQMRVALSEFDFGTAENLRNAFSANEKSINTILSLLERYKAENEAQKENAKNHEVKLLEEVKKIREKLDSVGEYMKLRLAQYQELWSESDFSEIFVRLKAYMEMPLDADLDIEKRRKDGELDKFTVQMLLKELERREQSFLKALEKPFIKSEKDASEEPKNFFLAESDKCKEIFGNNFFGYEESEEVINHCRKMDNKKPLEPNKDKLEAAKALYFFVSENPEVFNLFKGMWAGDTEHMGWRLSLDSADVSLANFVGNRSGSDGYSAAFQSPIKETPKLLIQDMVKLVKLGFFSSNEIHCPTSGSTKRKFSWRLTNVRQVGTDQYIPPKCEVYTRCNDDGYNLKVAQIIEDCIVQYMTLGKVSFPKEFLMGKRSFEMKKDKVDSVYKYIYSSSLSLCVTSDKNFKKDTELGNIILRLGEDKIPSTFPDLGDSISINKSIQLNAFTPTLTIRRKK